MGIEITEILLVQICYKAPLTIRVDIHEIDPIGIRQERNSTHGVKQVAFCIQAL